MNEHVIIKQYGAPLRIELPDGSMFVLTAHNDGRHDSLHIAAARHPAGGIATECTIVPVAGNAFLLRATR